MKAERSFSELDDSSIATVLIRKDLENRYRQAVEAEKQVRQVLDEINKRNGEFTREMCSAVAFLIYQQTKDNRASMTTSLHQLIASVRTQLAAAQKLDDQLLLKEAIKSARQQIDEFIGYLDSKDNK